MTPDTITYSSFIDGLCKSGRMSDVWDLIDEMHDRGQPADVIIYTSLMDALCKNHNLDEAIVLFRKIKDLGFQANVYMYTVLIAGLCSCGRLKDAQEVFKILLTNDYHVNVCIKGLCKEGLFDETLALLSKMEDNGCIPNVITYEIVIQAVLRKGKKNMAVRLLCEMSARGLL
ncbi:unnamed protein product [Vicia faba]|uniref:Pentatricopeptide repeat-containing protein n=1 Tax=Vicia faba TaxID=3906 RepID=A0AAV0YFW9_VICFA|nr:unnamed protein product [Vicia faba]